jgi:hypothetical protein
VETTNIFSLLIKNFGISNITNFNSFKTKELPTKGILEITPLIVNELYLLNTSFSKDNSIT